ncbi:MAG: DUF3006 domain-containing protein [Proteobacteria bacterium]|nr:DUF3006 domain-containing protein [Pseudomonadota bacterium]
MIVIDSISGNTARLEIEGVFVDIPRSAIPADCKEGDVLGFIKLDNTEILQKGADRLVRMRSMSNTSGDVDL